MAGISPAGPGYKRITIRPQIVGDLTYARASLKTVRGLAEIDWKKGHKSLNLKVTIPVNSTAEVNVPKMGLKAVTVTEGGRHLWKSGTFIGGVPGIASASETADYMTFETDSGSYAFEISGQ